jgi:hypothetical protein
MGETNVYGAPPQAHREPPPRIGFLYALTSRNPMGASPPPPGSETSPTLVPSALCEQPWVSMSQAILRETLAPPPSQRNALRIAKLGFSYPLRS